MFGVLLILLGMVWLDLALGIRGQHGFGLRIYAGCIQIDLEGLWVCGCLVLAGRRHRATTYIVCETHQYVIFTDIMSSCPLTYFTWLLHVWLVTFTFFAEDVAGCELTSN